MTKNKVSVISLEKGFERFEKEVKKTTLKILKILKKKNVSVEVYLAGSRKLRSLNKKFRGKNKTADVLSFEEPKGFIYPPPAGRSKFKKIGEIYLNLKVSNIKYQVSNLLIHGLIHLFGYHHQKKNDRMKMEKKEKYVHHCFRHWFSSN